MHKIGLTGSSGRPTDAIAASRISGRVVFGVDVRRSLQAGWWLVTWFSSPDAYSVPSRKARELNQASHPPNAILFFNARSKLIFAPMMSDQFEDA